MNNNELTHYLRRGFLRLIQGQKPISGEELADVDKITNKQILLFLQMSSELIESDVQPLPPMTSKQRSNVHDGYPRNHGLKWSTEELKAISEDFENKMNLLDMEKKHGRTFGAILAKLLDMKLITVEENDDLYRTTRRQEQKDPPRRVQRVWTEEE